MLSLIAAFSPAMAPVPGDKYCYNLDPTQGSIHDCKCDLTEDECAPPCTTETGLKDCQIWTETCKPFCQNPHGGDGPEGCYELETHKCECGTTEEECKAKPGYNSEWFWTPGCGTCATGSSAFVIQGYSM